MIVQVRYPSHPDDVKHYDSKTLRKHFLVEKIFIEDEANFVLSHFDRIMTGGVMPVTHGVELTGCKELCSDTFLLNREMGAINIGGKGRIEVDGVSYDMLPFDGLYVGLGAERIVMYSDDPENPAKFYVNSCPAHKNYPNVKVDIAKAAKKPLGDPEFSNVRTINQYFHPDVMQSCQLSMGMTVLEKGSTWNTMPCHTHDRRMEVYFYFQIPEDQCVFHFMGEGDETRHIVVKNEMAVISPSWSIHAGAGTHNYAFIWGMCGENKKFDDMDVIPTNELI